jgi:hypothetical protein
MNPRRHCELVLDRAAFVNCCFNLLRAGRVKVTGQTLARAGYNTGMEMIVQCPWLNPEPLGCETNQLA